jgi:hypothetical protein
MKDAEFVLEFTTPVLANSLGPDGEKDHFERDGSSEALIFQQSWWYSAFSGAIAMAGIRGIKPGDISMDLLVKAPTQMYKRRYGPDKFRTHEAIMRGAKVSFKAVVSDHVTESNLRAILERMGTYIGLSPYGHKLGFGHFKLVDLHVAPSDASKEAKLPESGAIQQQPT